MQTVAVNKLDSQQCHCFFLIPMTSVEVDEIKLMHVVNSFNATSPKTHIDTNRPISITAIYCP